ncbi:hypothetical protein BD413DRAFT_179640 [Trametes elegans]|nr:hypothetical protein BD413DRAFT_179640 [Trametes elegans]
MRLSGLRLSPLPTAPCCSFLWYTPVRRRERASDNIDKHTDAVLRLQGICRDRSVRITPAQWDASARPWSDVVLVGEPAAQVRQYNLRSTRAISPNPLRLQAPFPLSLQESIAPRTPSLLKMTSPRRIAACRNCADQKVACRPCEGEESCHRCVARGLVCERPTPLSNARDRTQPRVTCEGCRARKVKCEPPEDPTISACGACSRKGVACSLRADIATTPDALMRGQGLRLVASPAAAASTPPTRDAHGVGATEGSAQCTAHRSRAWLDVVLIPSS